MNFNNTNDFLSLIEDIFVQQPEDEKKLLTKLDLTEKEFRDIINGELEPDRVQNENIYNFAYNQGLYLNEILWQDRLDEFRSGTINVGSHGSRKNIEGPIRLDLAAEDSDFGAGFYIGQDIAQAGTWVAQDPNSSLYIFTFDEAGLDKAQFHVSIDWMLAICYFRQLIPQYADHPYVAKIVDKVNNCDFVVAPIADNKLYEIIESFVNEEITDLQCLYGLSATHLGYQYVLKTEKALQNLTMTDHLYFCSVEKSVYNKEADLSTNISLNKAFMAKKKFKDKGQYISDLLGDLND